MWSFCQKPSRILFRRVAVNETPRGFTSAACPLGANVEVLPGGIVSPDGLLGLSFIILQIDRYQSQTGFSLGLIFGCWFAYPWRSKCSESFGYQPAQEVMAAMSLTNQWVCHGVNSRVSCVFHDPNLQSPPAKLSKRFRCSSRSASSLHIPDAPWVCRLELSDTD